MNKPPKSNCCHEQVKVNEGDEGTNCYICSKCDRPCDIESGKVNASTPSHHTWIEEFGEKFKYGVMSGEDNDEDITFEMIGFILKVEKQAIARTVQEILHHLIPKKVTNVGSEFVIKVIRESIKNYAKDKGINDTTI